MCCLPPVVALLVGAGKRARARMRCKDAAGNGAVTAEIGGDHIAVTEQAARRS